jgi:predicted phosphohydrolase
VNLLPKIFGISDLHLPGSTGKTMDLFGPQWVEHEQKIAANWRRTVAEEDIVVIPGDISWAMKLEQAQPDLDLIGSLPGTKVLVRGNHDYWWQGIGKLRKILPPTVYAIHNNSLNLQGVNICGTRGWKIPGDDGFTQEDEKIYLRELQRLELSLGTVKTPGEVIVLLHYPPFGENKEPSGFVSLMKEYNVSKCVYGHLHGSPERGVTGLVDGITYYLVACDQIGFAPLLIENIK